MNRQLSNTRMSWAPQYYKTGRTKHQINRRMIDWSWNTCHDFLMIASLWAAALETERRCSSKVILVKYIVYEYIIYRIIWNGREQFIYNFLFLFVKCLCNTILSCNYTSMNVWSSNEVDYSKIAFLYYRAHIITYFSFNE